MSGRLNRLVEPFAHIDAGRHYWMPRGLHERREARLGESPQLLANPSHRNDVKKWYLEVFGPTTNTPNWDIAANATFNGGREGLMLVEAKAHVNELHIAGKPLRTTGPKASDPLRHRRIGEAIAEAGMRLNAIEPGFSLSRDSHYQLSNRFAWAWKVASMGVPVVLVYLGFLNAYEMSDRGAHFTSAEDWEKVMRRHAHGIVPEAAWGKEMMIDGTPMLAIIRADEVALPSLIDAIR